jgi:uncharacterized membrane protein YphA (DoxX/SURF4 family)
MRVLHFVSRIVVGVVFIFSGFVKGIDPLGMAYRIEDYFIAWNAQWMMPSALTLSVLLSAMEFVLGVVILLNLKPRISAWMLLGVMTFFTALTLNDAIYNPVPDCGCFGDAIKLTNWQTFYKNVFLMVFTIILFAWRKKTKEKLGNVVSYGLIGVVLASFFSLSIYCYRHLPLIDFMEWKVGNKMYNEDPLPVKYYLIYRNIETGETQEYLSPDYPYNDSVWMSQWEFVDQRIDDPNTFLGHDLQIMDTLGTDLTETIIQHPDYQFILTAWDLEKANQQALADVNQFAEKVMASGYGFVGVTSTLAVQTEAIREKLGLKFDILMADDIAIKVMVRANPGLLLLKDGVVIDKWHYNDFPTYEEFEKEYITPANSN